jgi:hypothetical protein
MDPEEYECLRRGRARASHRSAIPLLMLSSEEQLTEGAEEGTLRLFKPFSSSAILSMLHRLECDAPERS